MFNNKTRVEQRLKVIKQCQIRKHVQQPTTKPQRLRTIAERKQKTTKLARNTTKTLWTHLVFTRVMPKKVGRTNIMSRTPTVVNGLFNQVFALFTAVDLARTLGRTHLVVGNFFVQFNVKQLNVPVSKVIQLSSLLIPASDWRPHGEPTPSKLIQHSITYPSNAFQTLQSEADKTDLEIGCCLLFPLPGHTRNQHIQRMRFHPVFYDIVTSFLHAYPTYQVVHYRMESDFTGAFFRGWQYASLPECRAHLFQKYQNTLSSSLDPNIPTLVVSHYYKDPSQPRDHDLQWPNLIHFTLSPQQKAQLSHHLQLPPSAPMREVDAIIDFILCTTPHVRLFIGCGGSTFSESVGHFYNHHNCVMINPHNV